MKDRNGFLDVEKLNKQWRLVLPSTLNVEGKNLLAIAIAEAHVATSHHGIEKTINPLTDKFKCQSFSRLVREYVGRCDIYQRTNYAEREPIGYVTVLHVLIRACSIMRMNFLKLLSIFSKCSVWYPYIPVDEDHVVGISRLWTIVDSQSGFKILIRITDNFSTEQCTATFDTHGVPAMGYPYCIVFDTEALFIASHFQSGAASKGIKLEPSTAYHYQTDGQSKLMIKEIIHIGRACKAEGNDLLSKILEIQLRLNSPYNTYRRNNPLVIVLGFDAELGLDRFPYLFNKYQHATRHHNATY